MKNIFKHTKDTNDPIIIDIDEKIKVDTTKIVDGLNTKKTIDQIAKDLGIKKKLVEAIINIFQQMNLTKFKK